MGCGLTGMQVNTVQCAVDDLRPAVTADGPCSQFIVHVCIALREEIRIGHGVGRRCFQLDDPVITRRVVRPSARRAAPFPVTLVTIIQTRDAGDTGNETAGDGWGSR